MIGPKEQQLRMQRIERALMYAKRNGAASFPNPDMPRLKDYKPVTKKTAIVTNNEAMSRKRGRPRKPDALTAAERQRASRARKKATHGA